MKLESLTLALLALLMAGAAVLVFNLLAARAAPASFLKRYAGGRLGTAVQIAVIALAVAGTLNGLPGPLFGAAAWLVLTAIVGVLALDLQKRLNGLGGALERFAVDGTSGTLMQMIVAAVALAAFAGAVSVSIALLTAASWALLVGLGYGLALHKIRRAGCS